jgi:hypothetical protein
MSKPNKVTLEIFLSLMIFLISVGVILIIVKEVVFSIDKEDPCPSEYVFNEYGQCVKLNINKSWSTGLPGGVPLTFFDQEGDLFTIIANTTSSDFPGLTEGFKLYKTDENGINTLIGNYEDLLTGYVNTPDGIYVITSKYLGWNEVSFEHEHNIKLSKIDKISGESFTFFTELKYDFPYVDLAQDNAGNFYTNDIVNKTVYKISSGTKIEIAQTEYYPGRVTVDENNNVYIISAIPFSNSGQISKVTSTGIIDNFISFDEGELPTVLKITNSGEAYIATTITLFGYPEDSIIYKVDLNTGVKTEIANVGPNLSLFLEFDSKGNIYVPYLGSSLFDYDLNAKSIARISPSGMVKIINLDANFAFTIAINNQDAIYVASNYSTTTSHNFYNTTISKVTIQTDSIINKTTPVYRFFNRKNGAHLYTISLTERDAVKKLTTEWRYEGVKFYVEENTGVAKIPVYRFWNNAIGAHLYTISDVEKEQIQKTLPQYVYEGVKFYVYPNKSISELVPVYGFFNKQNGAHLYTISENERSTIQYTLPKFNFEGEKFYVFK